MSASSFFPRRTEALSLAKTSFGSLERICFTPKVLMPKSSETLALSPDGEGADLAPRAAIAWSAERRALWFELDMRVGRDGGGTAERQDVPMAAIGRNPCRSVKM
jgi:hypothetical protein